MRERGLVTAKRKGNWMIYSLSVDAPAIEAHLESLKKSFSQEKIFTDDAKRLIQVVEGENKC